MNESKKVTPYRLLLVTIGGIFSAEVVAMIIVQALRPLPYPLETLIDAMIMTALIFPVLYLLSFRPLIAQIDKRRQAEEALRSAYDELDKRVQERTKELASANENLQVEIAERRLVDEALHKALVASEQRQAEISALLEGARAILEQHEFPASARAIFDACKGLVGASAGYIALVKDELNEAVFLDAGSYPCSVDPNLPMPIRGFREQAYRSGKTVYDNHFQDGEWALLTPSGHALLDNVLFAPLKIDGDVVGLMGMANKPGGFSENDAQLATAFGELAAVALVNSRAQETMQSAHNELERRVQERTQELAQANQELLTEMAERERAESQLRLLSAALEAAANGIIITGRHGNIRWANPAFTQMTGYTLDEILGQNPRLLKSEKHAPEFYQQMWETILSGEVWHGETINRRKDGSQYFEEQTITPLIDEKGEITNFIAIKQDITERIAAEQAVRQSEALLRKVLENLPVGVWIIDQNGVVTQTNLAGLQIWAGVRLVGIEGYGEYKGWWLDNGELIRPEEWAAARAVTRGETSLDEEVEIECFDGTHKIVLNSALPILDDQGAIQGAIVVEQDITERKRADQLFKLALENLPVGVWITDELGNIVYGNPRGQQIWAGARYVGIEQFGEYKGWWLSTGKRIEPEEWAVARAIQGGETSLDEEIEIECFDGTHKIILNSAIPIRDERQSILGAFIVNQDITERKRAEDVLKQERQKLRNIMDTMPDGVYIVNKEFSIEYVNPVIEREFGPVEGRKCFQYFHDLSSPCEWCKNEEVFAGKSLHWEWRSGKNNKTYDLFDTPLVNTDGSISKLEIFHDITSRKLAEAQLERSNEELRTLSEAERRLRQLAEGQARSVIALTTSLELEDVLNTILDQIRRSIPFQGADILLVEGDTLRVASHRGFEDMPGSMAARQSSYALEDFPLFQQICDTLQPVLVPDSREDANWRVSPGLEWVRSYLAVPLVNDGQVIGIINLDSDQPGAFSPEAIENLVAFTASAALALHNAQQYKAERTARQTAETLRAAIEALIHTLDLDQRINTLLDHLEAIIPSDLSCVALLEGENRLGVRGMRGFDRLPAAKLPTVMHLNIADFPSLDKAISTRSTLLIADSDVYTDREDTAWIRIFHSWLLVPIASGEKVIGIVGLGKIEAGYFTKEHLQWVEALSNLAAVALQSAWLFEQVRDSSERLQFLSRRLVEVQENELRYVAQELHDEVGQALTSVVLGLNIIEKEAHDPLRVSVEAQEIGQMLDSAMENLHRLAMDLRPAALDKLGLEAALRQHIKTICNRFALEIRFEMIGVDERLSPNVEIALYRVVQEALNNIARHADATRVDILIQTRDGNLILIVEDNGVGFDPKTVMQGDRLGIFGMRERAEMLGGKLTIESSAGKGTTVLVEVPYEHENSHRR